MRTNFSTGNGCRDRGCQSAFGGWTNFGKFFFGIVSNSVSIPSGSVNVRSEAASYDTTPSNVERARNDHGASSICHSGSND